MISGILYRTLIGTKSLRIRFNKIDGFVKVYDGTTYLTFLALKKWLDTIRYLIGVTSGITYIFSHNYAKIKVDSHDSLPIEKASTLHIVIICIKSFLNEDQNHYYYNKFLEKCS